jgi:hypothetical protein
MQRNLTAYQSVTDIVALDHPPRNSFAEVLCKGCEDLSGAPVLVG